MLVYAIPKQDSPFFEKYHVGLYLNYYVVYYYHIDVLKIKSKYIVWNKIDIITRW